MTRLNSFYRGDSQSWTVRVASVAYDGWECWMTLKSDIDDADVDAGVQAHAAFGIDPEDGTQVMAVISLTPAETDDLSGRYYYDIQAVSLDGSQVKTLSSGVVSVLKDVTRTTSDV